ncbi:hypothetical protein CASFOL_006790 [Castilleja foliolosa]|uniref:Uncharacterized protein n=1 Tax=Castilleja foliolosa TaxID=1961234 RepID=A0ABD3E893_9LAMI
MSGKGIIRKRDINNNVNNLQLVTYSPHSSKRSNEVANWSIVPYENKVKETLKLYKDLYNELSNEQNREPKQEGRRMIRLDIEVANRLKKKGKLISPENRFGHIPGIKIGDRFHYRAELVVIGLHCQYVSGIDYVMLDGEKVATSIVNSGRYVNEAKTSDVLIYSGQGGKVKQGEISDQVLKHGNLALVNSCKSKSPVRVIRKTKNSYGLFMFVYEGLYIVNNFWKEKDFDRRQVVFKFEMHRMSDQEKVMGHHQSGGGSRKRSLKDCCLAYDVSQGKEKFAVRAMNGIDGERPGKFGYVTETVYPEWCKKIEHGGCGCIDGCSSSGRCVCVLKNGGSDIVYECGPFCKCPSSCLNRVSQVVFCCKKTCVGPSHSETRGSRYQLELFKTESNGWGVRSRSYISSGSFVCEYVGKLQQIKELNDQGVDQNGPCELFSFPIPKFKDRCRSDDNETWFVIDASKVGNVGRFIRHSKSPSLVVQQVLYDHDDVRMPHVMFFAAKNIPPLHELTCDRIEV